MERSRLHPKQANRDLVSLRSFIPADLPAMHALDQSCFRKGISYSLKELRLFTQQPASFSLIAETNAHRLAGFFIVERTRHHGAASGHVITIDVHPELRRRGIGRMLMRALEEYLIQYGAQSCMLEVAVDDPGAQEFYSSLGYRATARLRGYYMGRLDALVMEKELRAEQQKS